MVVFVYGSECSHDAYRILKQEYGYSINMSHKKAPTKMAKLTRIEQHAPTIRKFYFRDSNSIDDDYRRAMSELTDISFTAKNLHDDAPIALPCLRGISPNARRLLPWQRDSFN